MIGTGVHSFVFFFMFLYFYLFFNFFYSFHMLHPEPPTTHTCTHSKIHSRYENSRYQGDKQKLRGSAAQLTLRQEASISNHSGKESHRLLVP